MEYTDTLEQWEKKIWAKMPAPAKGMLLVANPFMRDPNFKRMVIFLVEHNEEGSLGYVLNQELTVEVPEIREVLHGFKAPVLQGGPVQLNTLHFIHRAGELVQGTVPITNEISWTGTLESLHVLTDTHQIDPNDFRFFVGYSGWGPEQLAKEQAHRSWLVTPATAELVFQPPEDAWLNVIKHMGGNVSLMANFPIDPSMN